MTKTAHRPRHSKSLRAVCALVALPALLFIALATGAASKPSGASTNGSATDKPCGTVELIFARGSGQNLGTSRETGGSSELDRLIDQLNSRIKSPLTHNLYELGSESRGGNKYPAVDVANPWNGNAVGAKLSAGYANDYGDSVMSGVLELNSYLLDRQQKCLATGSKFVLVGYSQGAQVMGQFLRYASDKMRANIFYTALFGDPKLHLPEGEGLWPAACRGEQLSQYRRVIASCHVDNGSLGARKPYLPNDMHAKTGLWCYADDYVCGSSKNLFNNGGHQLYGGAGNAVDTAVFEIATKLKDSASNDLKSHIILERDGGMNTTGLDVVFIIDTTGSMQYRIQQAREFAATNAEKIIAQRGRVALVTYRDHWDAYTARIESGFSDNLSEFHAKINALTVHGGGDEPEAALHAIMTAFNGLDWKYGATKAAVVLTDASYHQPDQVDGTTLEQVARRSLEIDPVNIYPVVPAFLESAYTPLAEQTSGQVIVDNGDSANALLEAVTKIQSRPTALLKHMHYYADAGQRVTFDASDSYVVDATIDQYEWDFDGDGVFEVTTATPIQHHIYPSAFDGVMQVRMHASNGTVANISAFVTIGIPPETAVTIPAPIDLTIDSLSRDTAVISWQPNTQTSASWGVSIDGTPVGKVSGSTTSTTIESLDRSKETVISVAAITPDGSVGETTSVTIPALLPPKETAKEEPRPTPSADQAPHSLAPKSQPLVAPSWVFTSHTPDFTGTQQPSNIESSRPTQLKPLHSIVKNPLSDTSAGEGTPSTLPFIFTGFFALTLAALLFVLTRKL